MQVFCPRCDTGYEIADELIKQRSRRVKCSSCGEVFTVDKISEENTEENAFDMLQAAMGNEQVAQNQTVSSEENITKTEVKKDAYQSEPVEKAEQVEKTEPVEKTETSETDDKNDSDQMSEKDEQTAEDEIDIDDIFERLSERTEILINEEKKLPFYKKILLGFRNIFGLQFRINWKYVEVFLAVFVVFWLFNNRYDVVRKFPFMNGIYKVVGINAKIPGEGLEFQNVSWEMLADGDSKKLDIKGFIFNQTDKDIQIPTLHVEILDKETALLQSQNRVLEENKVAGGEKIPMLMSIPNPAPTLKYVYMTFIDVD